MQPRPALSEGISPNGRAYHGGFNRPDQVAVGGAVALLLLPGPIGRLCYAPPHPLGAPHQAALAKFAGAVRKAPGGWDKGNVRLNLLW